MTTSTLAITRRPSRVVAIGIVGFAVALALASQVAIPIPGTPVPVTLQPLVVVLAGMWLGPVAGAASMILHLAAGAVGLPVFSPYGAPGLARFVGPTGGYLFAYPIAAFVAGAVSVRARSLSGRWLAALAGIDIVRDVRHAGSLTANTPACRAPSAMLKSSTDRSSAGGEFVRL